MFRILDRKIGLSHKPFIVAEISGNHKQSLSRVLKMIKVAKNAGADAVKIQTYTPDTMTLNITSQKFKIKEKKSLWFGENYYSLFNKAHTRWSWHKKIFETAKKNKIICFSTPFDETSLKFLEKFDMPAYKIASYENNDFQFIEKVAKTKKPLIISTGMSDLKHIKEIVSLVKKQKCKNFMLLKCTSSYPASPKDLNIKTIYDMRKKFKCEIGLSDHSLGIGASIAAISNGATLIEKHFTLNHNDGAVDSKFSLNPNELKNLTKESQIAWQSLGKISYKILKCENPKEKRSIFVIKKILKGQTFTNNNLKSLRPFLGLNSKNLKQVIGKKSKFNLLPGTPLKVFHFKK